MCYIRRGPLKSLFAGIFRLRITTTAGGIRPAVPLDIPPHTESQSAETSAISGNPRHLESGFGLSKSVGPGILLNAADRGSIALE